MCETLQREYEEGFRNGEARSQASIRKMQAELEESKSEMSHYLASERGGEVRVKYDYWMAGAKRAALQAAALQKTMGL